jgi:hypothetical protein
LNDRSLLTDHRLRTLAVLAFLLAGVCAAASSYFPEFYHVWSPRVGDWSAYRILDARGESAELTFSVVDKDGDAYWLEVRTKQEGAEGTVAYLVTGDPTEDENVVMIRAQETGGPALELDRTTLGRLRSRGQGAFGGEATPIGPKVGKLEALGEEKIVVGGKSLKCRRLKIIGPDQTAEVWLSEDVGPFGLVKLKSGLEEVVLQSFGRGAKPSLKGPFTPMSVP